MSVLVEISEKNHPSTIFSQGANSGSRDGSSKTEYVLFCKGADSKIYSLLRPTESMGRRDGEEEARVRRKTREQFSEWGNTGLRVLCFAWKRMSEDDAKGWLQEYNKAMSNMAERQLQDQGKENQIDKLCEEMESDLLLQGAVAIEDQLQEFVPETLSRLEEAGIRVWMVTG